jgi:hypothetical protein
MKPLTMPHRSTSRLVLVALVAITLNACGGSEDTQPANPPVGASPAPVPTSSPAPTATPTATPTAPPTTTPTVTPSATPTATPSATPTATPTPTPTPTASPPAQVSVRFTATATDFPNPERGFYTWASGDLFNTNESDFSGPAQSGYRILFGYTRLDSYRNSAIPQAALDGLVRSFNWARKHGVKLVPRFTYNFPANETEYLNAQDATLARVQEHVNQLKPILAAHEDVIAFFQAGFIGAWGEWHTSSNNLTSDANKLAVRDALLAAVPASRMIQMRYPYDLVKWFSNPATEAQAFGGSAAARIGMHNDCFLASATDVGTFDTTNPNDPARVYLRASGKTTPFGGETCNPAAESGAVVRDTCADILREGKEYSLTYLNADYYTGFHNKWKAQGCYDEVSRSMGYRFELVSASHAQSVARGAALNLNLEVKNTGWARLYNQRPLMVVLRNKATGVRVELAASGADARKWLSGATTSTTATVTVPVSAAAGDYEVLLALPDAATALRSDVRYSVRFANADSTAANQAWEAAKAEFRIGTTVKVQ